MANALSLGFSSHALKYGASAGTYVQRLAGTGIDTLRDDLSWSQLQPNGRGSAIITGPIDTLCGLCRTNGLKLIPLIGFAPAWANGGRDDKFGPLLASDFGDWVTLFVNYCQANHSDVVIAIEYWNEPDIGFLKNPSTGAQGDTAYYASLCADAYSKKPGGTTIKYWGGAASGAAPDWTWNVLTAMGGIGSLDFDEWSFHAYPAFSRAVGSPLKTAEQMLDTTVPSAWSEAFWRPQTHGTLLDVLNHFGYTGPVHNTEAGVPTLPPSATVTGTTVTSNDVPDCQTETQQQRWLELLWPMWTGQPRAGYFMVYTGQDDNTNSTASPPGRANHFGGVHTDGSAKPIIASLTALTAGGVTAYSNVVGPVTGPSGVAYSNVVGPVTAPDTTPPTVSLTAPANNATVAGTVTISATAADNVAVAQVEFLVDGVLVDTDPSSPYSVAWGSTVVPNGPHTITARATDTSGNTAVSAGRTVTVANATVGSVPRPHLSDPFPQLTLEIDFPHDVLAVPYRAQALATVSDPGNLPNAYYGLAEASGTSAAEEQGKTAGVYGGTVTYRQPSPTASDRYSVTLGAGGLFTGGVRYSATVSDLTPVGITLTGWFKAGAIGSTIRLISTQASGAPVLVLGSDGKLWVVKSDNFSNPARGSIVLTAGEWFFAALVITGTTPSDDPNAPPTSSATAYLMRASDLKLTKEVTGLQNFVDGWAGAGPQYGAPGISLAEPVYWVGMLTMDQLGDLAGRANPGSFGYPGFTWSDLTDRVRDSVQVVHGRGREFEPAAAAETTFTLDDPDRSLEPDYAGVPANLIPNPSFEVDLTGWSVFGAGTSADRITSDQQIGAASLELAFNGAAASYGRQLTVTGLVPGTTYTLSGSIKRAGSVAGQINLDVFEAGVIDTSGIFLASNAGTPAGAWWRYSDTFVYPLTGSGTVVVRAYGDGTPAGFARFDGIMLDPAAALNAYCDGDQPGCRWSGAAHASVSYRGGEHYPNVVRNRAGRLRATLAATSFDLARFFVPDWPVDWAARRTMVAVSATDLLGVLGTWPLAGKFAQQPTGARINRILDLIGWPASARLIDAGTQTVVKETVTGTTALAYLQLIAASDNGVFFTDPAGNAVFHDGGHRARAARSTVPQLVFGDADPGSAAFPYISVAYAKPSESARSQVIVSYGPAGAATAVANDYLSQRRGGVRNPVTIETRLVTHTAAQALAGQVLARYADPPARFTQIVLEPARAPGLGAKVLGLEVSDRVRVSHRPYAGGAVVTQDCWLERLQHQFAFGQEKRWQAVLALTAV